MNWYDHPPEWTAPIAGLSSWFIWPALSAIFSAAALASTIFLATQSNRDKRRREAAVIKAIIYPIATAANTLGDDIALVENDIKHARKWLESDARRDSYSDLLGHLNDIKITDIPSTLAIDYWSTGRDIIKDSAQKAPVWAKLPDDQIHEKLLKCRDDLSRFSIGLVDIARDLGGRVERHEDAVVTAYFQHQKIYAILWLNAALVFFLKTWRELRRKVQKRSAE